MLDLFFIGAVSVACSATAAYVQTANTVEQWETSDLITGQPLIEFTNELFEEYANQIPESAEAALNVFRQVLSRHITKSALEGMAPTQRVAADMQVGLPEDLRQYLVGLITGPSDSRANPSVDVTYNLVFNECEMAQPRMTSSSAMFPESAEVEDYERGRQIDIYTDDGEGTVNEEVLFGGVILNKAGRVIAGTTGKAGYLVNSLSNAVAEKIDSWGDLTAGGIDAASDTFARLTSRNTPGEWVRNELDTKFGWLLPVVEAKFNVNDHKEKKHDHDYEDDDFDFYEPPVPYYEYPAISPPYSRPAPPKIIGKPQPSKGKEHPPPPSKGKEHPPPPSKGKEHPPPPSKGKEHPPPPSKEHPPHTKGIMGGHEADQNLAETSQPKDEGISTGVGSTAGDPSEKENEGFGFFDFTDDDDDCDKPFSSSNRLINQISEVAQSVANTVLTNKLSFVDNVSGGIANLVSDLTGGATVVSTSLNDATSEIANSAHEAAHDVLGALIVPVDTRQVHSSSSSSSLPEIDLHSAASDLVSSALNFVGEVQHGAKDVAQTAVASVGDIIASKALMKTDLLTDLLGDWGRFKSWPGSWGHPLFGIGLEQFSDDENNSIEYVDEDDAELRSTFDMGFKHDLAGDLGALAGDAVAAKANALRAVGNVVQEVGSTLTNVTDTFMNSFKHAVNKNLATVNLEDCLDDPLAMRLLTSFKSISRGREIEFVPEPIIVMNAEFSDFNKGELLDMVEGMSDKEKEANIARVLDASIVNCAGIPSEQLIATAATVNTEGDQISFDIVLLPGSISVENAAKQVEEFFEMN